MSILIVDKDEAKATAFKEQLASQGFKRITILSEAFLIQSYLQSAAIDLICLKVGATQLESFETISQLKSSRESEQLPLVVLLELKDAKYKQVALSKGANDVFIRPFHDMRYRLRNLLETQLLHKKHLEEKDLLQRTTEASVVQLERAQIEMLIRLAHAAEYRDDESGEHVWRVAHTSWLLGLELGLSTERAELILRAARLHDVGKIGIPDSILRKPSKLTAAEFEVIKTHTTIGAKLLAGGESELLKMAEVIALTHHERWNGSGYPRQLKGDDIPLEGQIVGLVDTFDALTSNRIHQRAWSVERAIEEIEKAKTVLFSARLVDAFKQLFDSGALPYDSEQPGFKQKLELANFY